MRRDDASEEDIMTVNEFLDKFLHGEIRTPFSVDESGLKLLDGSGKVVIIFSSEEETYRFTKSVSRRMKRDLKSKRAR
jgi:hypothetical protein